MEGFMRHVVFLNYGNLFICFCSFLLHFRAEAEIPADCDTNRMESNECSNSNIPEGSKSLTCSGPPLAGEEVVFLQGVAFKTQDTWAYTARPGTKGVVIAADEDNLRIEIEDVVQRDGGQRRTRILVNVARKLQIVVRASCTGLLQEIHGESIDGGWIPDMIISGQLWDMREAAYQDAAANVEGVRRDALLRRFVAWNATDLSRGVMDASRPTLGRDRGFDYQSWFSAVGFVKSNSAHGRILMKSVWDLQLFSMLIQELRPRTIIEIGTGSGASALWFADELLKLGNAGVVHTFDTAPENRPTHSRVVWHPVNSDDVEMAFPEKLLNMLPHPWLVDEDAHANPFGTARHFFKHMQVGDYYVCEDADSNHLPWKRQAWYAWLNECGKRCALDLMYADFYGVNLNWAPDGWIKKIAD